MNPMQPGAPFPHKHANVYAAPGGAWPGQQMPYPCARCGSAGADYFPPGAAPMHRPCAGLGPDVLPWPWLILAYSLAVVPYLGCTFIGALLVSSPYYVWRAKYPLRAKNYNRHVWIAFGVGCLIWGGWLVVSALLSSKK